MSTTETWFVDNLVNIVTLIISSAIAVILVVKFRGELSYSEQVSNIPNFLNDEYDNRKVSVDGSSTSLTEMTLKQARNKLINEDKTEEEFNEIKKQIMIPGTWQNKYAYEASIAMTHIGLAILAGAIPIKMVLPNISCIIIEDWRFCKDFIANELRVKNPVKSKRQNLTEPIFYSRRFAEWLAYASAVYIYRYWEIEKKQGEISATQKALDFLPENKAMRREWELRRAEILCKPASKKVEELLYTRRQRLRLSLK